MSFSWGALTEDRAGADAPPPGAVTHESTVEVVGYERRDLGPADGGWAVFSTLLTERFTGGVEGTGYAEHLRVQDPDGTQIAVGVERVVGSVAGRTGSFVLTSHARDYGSDGIQGSWTVVPGSATGELAGLRGRGEFTARLRPDGKWYALDTFTHWFAPR